MADTTAVNAQITDAVTRSNVKVLAESPAEAVGAIYQTIAQSVSIAMQNAVAQQSNQFEQNNAATTEGVALLYSALSMVEAANSVKTREYSPEAIREKTMRATAASASAFATQHDGVSAQVEAAVKLANDTAFAYSGDLAYAIRAGADALAAALRTLGDTLHQDRMRMLQMAATAVCLDAMLRDPSKAAEYEAVLQVVKRLA